MTPRLDHLVLPVSSLDEAADQLATAGFVVTPPTEHPFGTGNRLVVFENGYLELVTVLDRERIPPEGFARAVLDHLDRGAEGFSHIVAAARSTTEAGRAARERGMETGEPMWFSRRAPRTDGSELTASFTLLPLADAPHLFFCVHHTPEAIWFGPHLEHPNGARRIEAVRTGLELRFDVEPVTGGPAAISVDAELDRRRVGGVEIA